MSNSVVDVKPNNQAVFDVKPNNAVVSDQTTIYHSPKTTVIIPIGQWIPIAGFTYSQALTVTGGGGVRP